MGNGGLRTIKIHANTYVKINRLRAELMLRGINISLVRFVDELVKRYGEDFVRQLLEEHQGDGSAL